MNNDKVVRQKIKKLATKFALKEVGGVTNPVRLVEVCGDAIRYDMLPQRFLYNEEVELPCIVNFDVEEKTLFRTDYILVPRSNIMRVGEMFGVKLDNTVKSMGDFRMNLLRKCERREPMYERILLSWGTEVYQLAGADLLTCQDEICKKCNHKCILRSYIMSPLLAGMIEASNISVVEISYPCKYTDLNSILRGYNLDPPKVKVVFPKKA